jgi:prepilin-type N-terminal cleavage/methylation domain-containing protein
MKALYMNDKGFSLTELMFAMSILAVGLLAMAQMQIMAMRGTSSARDFSVATNLAREGVEQAKITGLFTVMDTKTGPAVFISNAILVDENTGNDDDASHAPDITKDTDIVADIDFDTVEVLKRDPSTDTYDQVCWRQHTNNCDSDINNTASWDFVRIYNVRNIPSTATDEDVVMKDINVIVLWKDGNSTKSVNLRTIVARKDNDFF